MKFEITIRAISASEIPFLDEMLYEAIYVPDGEVKLSKEIIYQPALFRYIKNFGRKGDVCFVAAADEKLVGAVWTRIFTENEQGYGFVDSNTPELSMAIDKPYRGVCIGTKLLETIIAQLTALSYNKISLSVNKRNFAYNFYQKYGFIDFKRDGNNVIMIKYLQ